MMNRVAILHQGCVPDYRHRFFERLAERGTCRYVVFHGDPPPGTGIVAAREPFAFAHVRVRNRYLRLGRRFLVYQPVLGRVIFGGFDAVVLGHEVKFLANLVLSLVFRALGKPVLLWGLGFDTGVTTAADALPDRATRRALAQRVAAKAKAIWALHATSYLAYTRSGGDRVAAQGLARERIHVLRNTIDTSRLIELNDACAGQDPAAIRRALGIDTAAPVLLYVGRLVTAKRVDMLVEFAAQRAGLSLVIVGDGPERRALETAAGGLPRILFWGHLPAEDMRLAMAFRVSAALVIPGYIGLAVNHAFAHGRPVVTIRREGQGPEIEYVEHGVNGLVIEDEASFERALQAFLDDPALQRRLAEGALATRRSLSLEAMARNFDDAVCASFASTRVRVKTRARGG